MAFFSLKTVMKVNGEFQPFYVKSFRHLRKVLSLLAVIVLFNNCKLKSHIINPLSAEPFSEKSVFRLREFYLCNAISDDWFNLNTNLVANYLFFQK